MDEHTSKLIASFPHAPYDIQQQFMINVVDTLDKRQIGLFESPTGVVMCLLFGLRSATRPGLTVQPHACSRCCSATPPPGTGKTLSIICSTLHWLEVERERQQREAAEAAAQGRLCSSRQSWWRRGDAIVVHSTLNTTHAGCVCVLRADCEGLPDWLAGAQTTPEPPATAQQPHKGQQRHKAAHKVCVLGAGIVLATQHNTRAVQPHQPTCILSSDVAAALCSPLLCPNSTQAKAAVAPLLDEEGNDLSEFLPDHGSTTAATPNQHQQQQGDTASPGTKRTAPDTGGFISTSEDEDEAAAGAAAAAVEDDVAAAAGRVVQRKRPQIIFCSRTHSQLSQFVGELHRTRFADSILLIAVASRKALCVNQEVGERDRVGCCCSQVVVVGLLVGWPSCSCKCL